MTIATNAKFSNGELVKCFGRTYKVIASAKDWCENVYIYSLKDLHSGHYVSRKEVDVYPITQKGEAEPSSPDFQVGDRVYVKDSPAHAYRHLPRMGEIKQIMTNKSGTLYEVRLDTGNFVICSGDKLELSYTSKNKKSKFQVGDIVKRPDGCHGTVEETLGRNAYFVSFPDPERRVKHWFSEDDLELVKSNSTDESDFQVGDRVWVTTNPSKPCLGTIIQTPVNLEIHYRVKTDYNFPEDILAVRPNELQLAEDRYWPDSKHSQDNFKDAVKHVLRNQISPYASDDDPVSHDQLRAITAQVTNVTVGDLRKMARDDK